MSPPILRRLVGIVLLALAVPVVATPLAGAADTSAPRAAAACATPLLATPRPAAEVRSERPAAFAEAVERVDDDDMRLRPLARDASVWLDGCGAPFYVEPRHEHQAAPAAASTTATALAPGTDVLDLESAPGAPLTIYLDVLGEQVSGTPWNRWVRADPLVAAPMSLDGPVDTNFSAAERAAVHQAWLVVSEDFAPFGVNVTTRDPGADALRRSTAGDPRYGARVLVTTGGPVGELCRCGGAAYPGVFDTVSSVEPSAWVFADALHSGWSIGDAASHEVGHLLGLAHDGTTAGDDYYRGHGAWGAIMGVAYHRALSQWSQGEYAGANNREDDLAIIGEVLPPAPDDHPDVAESATAVPVGGRAQGVIGTRADVDAFTFVGGGETTVEVGHPSSLDTDLDLKLTVLDPTGQVVQTVDAQPAAGTGVLAHPVDPAFAATWTAVLPEPAASYVLLVEGTGAGDPGGTGYSDYGSLGRYEVAVSTGPPGSPLLIGGPERLRVGRGRAFERTGLSVSGGVAPHTWSAHLGPGVTIDPVTGLLFGQVDTVPPGGVVAGYVQVRDARGATATHWLSLEVEQVAVTAQPEDLLVDVPVSVQLEATGRGPLTWSVVGDVTTLPPGLALSPTGVLSGVPTTAGTWSVPVHVGNDATETTGALDLVVAHRQPTFSTRRLDRGRVGRRYADVVRLDHVVGPVRWRVSGRLPSGLGLRPARAAGVARVTGVPERRGRHRFTLRARDRATGLVVERTFRVRIARR